MDITFLTEHLGLIAIVAISIIAVLTVITIVALVTAVRANRKFKSFTQGIKVENVEELLRSNAEVLRELENTSEAMKQDIHKLECDLAFAIQRVGIVKYDAFDNVGSHLSFSLALLDQFKNGVVITSIYGRDFTTIYGKSVKYGKSEYPLSKEEEDAIDRALKGEFKEKHLRD